MLRKLEGAPPSMARRRLLTGALGLALLPFYAAGHSGPSLRERPRFVAYPFALGVASGTPTSNSVVLWTRLAPDPLHGGGIPRDERIRVSWEIAADEAFTQPLQRGDYAVASELGYSAHVEVRGLEPDRPYWYRFLCGDAVSPVGRTRTLPAGDAAADHVRLAVASCQHYEQGYYHAYRQLCRDEPHFMAFVGDYIYESSWGAEPVRVHENDGREPHSLVAYRNRLAQYRLDPDLQAAHAAMPWFVTVDDHEIDNDWAIDRSEHLDPQFAQRRANALQAYFEHMPLPMASLNTGASLNLYRHFDFGSLARFYLLDTRQFRDPQPCPREGMGGASTVSDRSCPSRRDPARSLLGAAQERWLEAGFAASRARWNVLTQQTLLSQLAQSSAEEPRHYTEIWDGYPAARERLLRAMEQHRLSNPLVLGGDVHCTWAMDVKRDFDNPRSKVVATEFSGTSMTSAGYPQSVVDGFLPLNPHAHYGNSEHHGYLLVDLRRDGAEVQVRSPASIKDARSPIATARRFRVEHGRPGVQPG